MGILIQPLVVKTTILNRQLLSSLTLHTVSSSGPQPGDWAGVPIAHLCPDGSHSPWCQPVTVYWRAQSPQGLGLTTYMLLPLPHDQWDGSRNGCAEIKPSPPSRRVGGWCMCMTPWQPWAGLSVVVFPWRSIYNGRSRFRRLQQKSEASSSYYLVCSSHPSSLPPSFS